MASSTKLYDGCPPCDLISDVAYLNTLQAKIPEVCLHDGDAREHRKGYLQQLDESNHARRQNGSHSEQEASNEAEIIDDILRINVAFKTIEILGQIIKDFSGSIKAEAKAQLATECFSVDLRTLFLLQVL